MQAEDLLLRTMEQGKANELNMAIEIAGRHGVKKDTIAGAKIISDRLTDSYLGFDGPGAYKNKLAQAERDDFERDKHRAQHERELKKLKDLQNTARAEFVDYNAKKEGLEAEYSGLKADLAEKILDAIQYRAFLEVRRCRLTPPSG